MWIFYITSIAPLSLSLSLSFFLSTLLADAKEQKTLNFQTFPRENWLFRSNLRLLLLSICRFHIIL